MTADLVTPTRARDLLERHGLRTKRSLGQHFLVDPNTVRRIVRLARIDAGDTVLEIGPGLGSLTACLASAARRVVAVELDEAVAAALREVVGGAPNVEVVVADALRCDLRGLCGGPARLVANLPYNIATPLIARVLDDVPEVGAGLVMVQKELGERWTAAPGSKAYGAISVKVAYHTEASVAGVVPRTVFLPPPRVDSVLVAFARRPRPPVHVRDPAGFFRFVAAIFTHRRKTLRNALGSVAGRAEAESAIDRTGVEPTARPERIDLESFAALYAATGQ